MQHKLKLATLSSLLCANAFATPIYQPPGPNLTAQSGGLVFGRPLVAIPRHAAQAAVPAALGETVDNRIAPHWSAC